MCSGRGLRRRQERVSIVQSVSSWRGVRLQYRLIALDVDGTLFCARHQVSPRTLAALAAARRRGAITVIATGRTPQSALRISREIGGGPVVCCNGAGVLDDGGRILHQCGIPTDALLKTLALGRRAGLLMHCYTPEGMVLDQPVAHLKNAYAWLRTGVQALQAARAVARLWGENRTRLVPRLSRWAAAPDRPPVLKLMMFGDPDMLPAVAAEIRREVQGVEVTSSGADNLEVTAAGISKASGLKVLGERLDIPPEAMIAFGDSDNDLTMLRYVGLGVAMGNAAPHVRAAADRVAPPCDQDGVAHVLEEVCGG